MIDLIDDNDDDYDVDDDVDVDPDDDHDDDHQQQHHQGRTCLKSKEPVLSNGCIALTYCSWVQLLHSRFVPCTSMSWVSTGPESGWIRCFNCGTIKPQFLETFSYA